MERNRDSERRTLQQFRGAIPFLRKVPDGVYFNLNPWSFHYPEGEIARLRVELEGLVDNHVMTYQRDKFDLVSPLEEHLCAVLDMPDLNSNPESLAILNQYEARVIPDNVSFVVYQKPVKVINPYASWLAPIYRKRGLISSVIGL